MSTATLKMQGFGGDAELSAMTTTPLARFNKKYPNVKVELSVDPISTGLGRLRHQGLQPVQFRSAGRCLWHGDRDLPELLVAAASFCHSTISLPQILASRTSLRASSSRSSYKGDINYIPIGWNNIMINYNRDLFDKAGIAYPKDGKWTWDEFRDVAPRS
ncbi:extracellular solute-binding protein (plasmid) [Sinorhizobium sp. B11]